MKRVFFVLLVRRGRESNNKGFITFLGGAGARAAAFRVPKALKNNGFLMFFGWPAGGEPRAASPRAPRASARVRGARSWWCFGVCVCVCVCVCVGGCVCVCVCVWVSERVSK